MWFDLLDGWFSKLCRFGGHGGVGCCYCNCVPLFVSKCSGASVRLLPASGYNLHCTAEAIIILMLCLCTVFDRVSLTTATTLTVMYGKYMAQSAVQWLDYKIYIIIYLFLNIVPPVFDLACIVFRVMLSELSSKVKHFKITTSIPLLIFTVTCWYRMHLLESMAKI